MEEFSEGSHSQADLLTILHQDEGEHHGVSKLYSFHAIELHDENFDKPTKDGQGIQ